MELGRDTRCLRFEACLFFGCSACALLRFETAALFGLRASLHRGFFPGALLFFASRALFCFALGLGFLTRSAGALFHLLACTLFSLATVAQLGFSSCPLLRLALDLFRVTLRSQCLLGVHLRAQATSHFERELAESLVARIAGERRPQELKSFRESARLDVRVGVSKRLGVDPRLCLRSL